MKKSNYIYLYDNDFISLLSLIKILITKKVIPCNIKPNTYTPSLFEETFKEQISENEIIIKEIIDATSFYILNTMYKIFLSEHNDKEIIIYYFFVHALKYQNKIYYMRNLKSVTEALKIEKFVEHETHKFKGFLRFKELKGGILYATIEPDNNIILFLSKHFKQRLQNEFWIIEDKKRQLISIYDKNNFYITSSEFFNILDKELSEAEEDIENLWKNFYKTIAIKERTNYRCRMNFMPKKYWKYIIEMSDKNENSY